MRDVLNQPYPFFHKGSTLLRNTLLILVIGFCFDYFFEPFNVNRAEHKFDYWAICLFHVGGATVMYFVYSSVVNQFVDEDDWVIGKEVIYSVGLLLLIGVLNFLWREVIYDNPNNVSAGYFVEEIKNTFLVGSLILFVIVSINFNLLRRKNQAQADHFHPVKQETITDTRVPIQAAIPSDNFELDPAHVLCIRSDGNYVEFYVQEGEETKKLIKRLTLQRAADQLMDFPFIQKTHRAFLVNTRQVQRIEGNAQGYQLTIDRLPFSVPVSRKHMGQFNAVMG
jgi:hypothetical protein